MKEIGLMFKAPLVRSILSGHKTQTRRLVDGRVACIKGGKAYTLAGLPSTPIKPRYGDVGDLIYVRETFSRVPTVCGSDELVYAADYQDGSDKAAGVKYTPAIHMPKSAARIWLEITGMRVERLNDISESDTHAEGCDFVCMTPTGDDSGSAIYGPGGFAELWNSTGGDWAANPWVWVVNFKRIEKP